jgi:RNA polymerase sigma-70 factor (ECF subfamily)
MASPERYPNPHADDDLLRRFLAGEAAAYRTVDRWARDIVRFRPYGIPRSEHDDVVQQAIAMLWTTCSRDEFALQYGLRALLRRIVFARCVDFLRRRRRTEELDDTIVDPGPGPDESLAEQSRWTEVAWALRGLNPRCRDIIRMHYLEELPYAKVAQKMGIAAATVRVHMFNCLKEVRRRIDAGPDAGAEG